MVRQPVVSGIVIAVTSILMVSRLPTPSIKYMKLQRQHRLLAAICFAALAALLIAWPWATMTIGLLIYVASIPFAIFAHHPRYATRTTP
jgi:CDP-diacylglycerol--serine O-phosphatidyltransferase